MEELDREARLRKAEKQKKELHDMEEEMIADAVIQGKAFPPLANNQAEQPRGIAEKPGEEEEEFQGNPSV